MIKIQGTEGAIAVIDYSFPSEKDQRQVRTEYANIFLTQFERIEILVTVVYGLSIIRHVVPGQHKNILPKDTITFIFDDAVKTNIDKIEQEFEQSPGIIYKLLEKASHSKDRMAGKKRLTARWIPVETLKKDEGRVNGLMYYELAERSHAILHEVVAAYSRMLLGITGQGEKNSDVIRNIKDSKELALKILRNADNFTTLIQMQEILDKYTPIAKELHKKALEKIKN